MEMPVQDGISTVRWVREQERTQGRPRCRIVMVSSNEDPASAQRALDAGADTFLAKPVSAEALLSALRPEEPAGDEPAVPALARLAEDGAVIVDPAWKDHYPAFLGAQRETVQAMESALAAGDRERLRFLAHRASGSLAMMGLDRAARENRRLQAEALHASRETLHARLAWLRDHLGALRIA
jgi:two-component system sensor histidine kinase EvgS